MDDVKWRSTIISTWLLVRNGISK